MIIVIREQFLEENGRETTDNGAAWAAWPRPHLGASKSLLSGLVSLGHSGVWDIGCQDIMIMKLLVIRWDNS